MAGVDIIETVLRRVQDIPRFPIDPLKREHQCLRLWYASVELTELWHRGIARHSPYVGPIGDMADPSTKPWLYLQLRYHEYMSNQGINTTEIITHIDYLCNGEEVHYVKDREVVFRIDDQELAEYIHRTIENNLGSAKRWRAPVGY